jgi:hypothetical protein
LINFAIHPLLAKYIIDIAILIIQVVFKDGNYSSICHPTLLEASDALQISLHATVLQLLNAALPSMRLGTLQIGSSFGTNRI